MPNNTMTSVLKIAKGSLGRRDISETDPFTKCNVTTYNSVKDCVVKQTLPAFRVSKVYGKRLIDPVLQITTLLQ
jgi:hypothetical protein